MTMNPDAPIDQPPFQPGDRVRWSGKLATVTRLHDTAPQMFIRIDQGFFGQEVLIGFENEGIEKLEGKMVKKA